MQKENCTTTFLGQSTKTKPQEMVLVVSGSCPKCGQVQTAILKKPQNKFSALCSKHGMQRFNVLTSALRSKDEAEAMLRGEVI